MCDVFIQHEVELWNKIFRVVKNIFFYLEPASDQYDIFWLKFPE
jgi:hypothetical protein